MRGQIALHLPGLVAGDWVPPGCALSAPAPACSLEGHSSHLEHGVGEEGLQRALFAVRLGLVLLEELVKVPVLLAVSQDLQAVLVVAHELLIDVEHGQQDVEQVGCGAGGVSKPEGPRG